MAGRTEASRVVLVLSTVDREEAAARIARELVERRLAACVNIVPGVRSIYRWQGRVEDERELLLIVKSTHERLAELVEAIGRLHPYDVPEIVALDPADVAPAYASWLVDAVRPA